MGLYQELRKTHGLNRFAKVQCGERLAIPEQCQLGSGRVDLGGLRLANPALFKNVGSGSGNSKKARKVSTDSKKEKKKPGRPAGSTNKVSQETKKKKPEPKAQSKETIR